MNIQDAVKMAIETNSCITCTTAFWHGRIKIKPTDTPDCCMVIHLEKNTPPVCGWQPQAQHLISNDWIVVD